MKAYESFVQFQINSGNWISVGIFTGCDGSATYIPGAHTSIFGDAVESEVTKTFASTFTLNPGDVVHLQIQTYPTTNASCNSFVFNNLCSRGTLSPAANVIGKATLSVAASTSF